MNYPFKAEVAKNVDKIIFFNLEQENSARRSPRIFRAQVKMSSILKGNKPLPILSKFKRQALNFMLDDGTPQPTQAI
jgi:hypothetical protein